MEITTYYPGSFGEIVQGKFRQKDILCSCPIELFTKVKIWETNNPTDIMYYLKSKTFIENILKDWNLENYIDNIDIKIESQIPRGKGFASSTADLCATYQGLLKLFNNEYNEEELIKNCIKIEPTDSIIFDKLTIFDYKNGNYKNSIGDYIEFNILVFEGKNTVDTVEFNKKVLLDLNNIDDLVEILINAIKDKDIEKIAYCSTESIIRNSKRLEYDILPLIFKIQRETGGLGIIGAHSGDALGIIYSHDIDTKCVDKYLHLLKDYKIYKLKTIKF